MSIQIIYYSRYGSTVEIAQTIGKKLGTDAISDIRNLKEINGDLIIIGSAIFTEVPDEEILRLLEDEEGKLKSKQVAIFVVCLRKEYLKAGDREVGGPVYIDKMEKALGKSPLTSKIFGGRMIVAELEGEDLKRTEEFSKKQGMPFTDVNIMAESEVDEFIQDIKAKIDL
jgi:menaquinone-dependent protoporphyrinogen IX oxidase